VIVLDVPGDTNLRLLGVVRGLISEVPGVLEKVQAFAPEAVALGLTPSETEALETHFVGTPTEPVVPLAPTEVVEAKALTRYGDVGVPHPAFVELLSWGRTAHVPVEGIDPDEEVQAELFVAHIGYFELVRRTVRERRTGRNPPEAPDADAFALAWDSAVHPGRGSARYALERERAFVGQLAELRTRYRRVVAVVDRERVQSLGNLVAAR
jgi:hypothetical protein